MVTDIIEAEVQERITPEVRGRINSLSELLSQADDIVIDSEENAKVATNLAGQLRDVKRYLKAKNKDWTEDLVEAKKRIDSWFKRFTSRVDAVEPILDAKIQAYIKEKQRKAEEKAKEQQRIIDEAFAKKQKEEEAQAKAEGREAERIEPIKVEPEKVILQTEEGRSFGTRKNWTFSVENITQVPDEYKEVNSVKVNKAIREGVREIPGLKIFQEEIGVRR